MQITEENKDETYKDIMIFEFVYHITQIKMYGMPYGGARVDVNGDGIPDVRVGPYGGVRPDVGTFVHGPYCGAPYYPPPIY